MNLKKIADRRTAVTVLNIVLIGLMTVVMCVGASYTVLIGDDFTNGVRIGAFHVPFFAYVGASFDYVKSMYLDW